MAGDLPEAIDRWLRAHDHDVARFGALAPGDNDAWPSVGRAVGECVAGGGAEYGDTLLLDRDGRQHCGEQGCGHPGSALRRRGDGRRRSRMERCKRALLEPACDDGRGGRGDAGGVVCDSRRRETPPIAR